MYQVFKVVYDSNGGPNKKFFIEEFERWYDALHNVEHNSLEYVYDEVLILKDDVTMAHWVDCHRLV